jgi:RNA polymerase sigma-70 factor (ECF subfamily)
MTDDQNSDRDLISRFQGGDQAAFDEIVLRHQDRIYGLCRRMLGSPQDAEDAAQDTFLKAYQNLGSFEPRASLSTWLYRIAMNTCIDRSRKPVFGSLFRRSPEGEELMIEPPSQDPSPERLAEAKQQDRALWQGLGRLSPKLRAAILLKELEGLSYEQIAEVFGISLGTVKSRISRAREELLEQMER